MRTSRGGLVNTRQSLRENNMMINLAVLVSFAHINDPSIETL